MNITDKAKYVGLIDKRIRMRQLGCRPTEQIRLLTAVFQQKIEMANRSQEQYVAQEAQVYTTAIHRALSLVAAPDQIPATFPELLGFTEAAWKSAFSAGVSVALLMLLGNIAFPRLDVVNLDTGTTRTSQFTLSVLKLHEDFNDIAVSLLQQWKQVNKEQFERMDPQNRDDLDARIGYVFEIHENSSRLDGTAKPTLETYANGLQEISRTAYALAVKEAVLELHGLGKAPSG